MTFEKIISDIQKRDFKPIYFLMGEEAYYIDVITDLIAKTALTPDEQSFNQSVLYGKDIEVALIDNTARRFPMMAKHQVVIVKEAQNIKKIEDLVHYANKPQPSTILVIAHKYKSLAKNTKLYKALERTAVVFESKKLYDNQVPDWINNYLKSKQMIADNKAVQMLAEFLGTDLSKIVNEIDKLAIGLPVGTRITADIVEKNIGISKEFNNFELHDALTERNVLKANRIINYFAQNPKDNPIVVTINSLYTFYSKVLVYHYLPDKNDSAAASVLKVAPFFVKKYKMAAAKYSPAKTVSIISYLREYDVKSKGVDSGSMEAGEILRELIFKILH